MVEISLAAPSGVHATDASAAPIRGFDEVYTENAALIIRALRRYGIRPDAVEDCTQEVFIVAARRWNDRADGVHLRAWLLAIARNVARHHRRGQARKERRERAAPALPTLGDPAKEVEIRDALRFVDSFLATLSEGYREVFVLSQIEGLTAPEIETALGVRRATIYTRINRVRRAFAQALEARERSESSGER